MHVFTASMFSKEVDNYTKLHMDVKAKLIIYQVYKKKGLVNTSKCFQNLPSAFQRVY